VVVAVADVIRKLEDSLQHHGNADQRPDPVLVDRAERCFGIEPAPHHHRAAEEHRHPEIREPEAVKERRPDQDPLAGM
jgi:hypothetical protein